MFDSILERDTEEGDEGSGGVSVFLGGGRGRGGESGLTATLKRDSGETRVEVFSGVRIK